ncbi:hypothetical protein [Microbulbifer sp. ALW1]|uniref:hypothetical protein n=1 Tax=Microbulbifer sp. (strain ALW1) TaxID=1516059 RepID=UPI0013583A10|nr:hypothetical protein [Microbulbifer sp. ALW1]
MRLMMEVVIPVEKGNAAVSDGSLQKAFEDFEKEAKPEAAYFFVREGKRAALFIFEAKHQGELVRLNEPFFIALHAEVRVTPVLVAEELQGNLQVKA